MDRNDYYKSEKTMERNDRKPLAQCTSACENFDLNNRTQLLVILTKVQVPLVSTVMREIHLTCQRCIDILLHCMHFILKCRPINYSFVCMLISPLRLVNMYKKQKNFEVKTRRGGLINIQTEE